MSDQKILCATMTFGTADNPHCGICQERVVLGENWDGGNLVNGQWEEDVICRSCANEWVYDEDNDCYIRDICDCCVKTWQECSCLCFNCGQDYSECRMNCLDEDTQPRVEGG